MYIYHPSLTTAIPTITRLCGH